MKKFTNLMVVMLTVFFAGSFMACSNDDDKEKDKDTLKADVKYKYTISEDLLKVADFTVTYYDKNGVKQETQMTDTIWNMEFEAEELPVTLGYKIASKPKENLQLDKESYTASSSKTICIVVGDEVMESSFNGGVEGIHKERMEAYLSSRRADVNKYHVDAEGKITNLSLDEEF